MSKIKNGGLDQYGAEPFEQQQFGTAGIERVSIHAALKTGLLIWAVLFKLTVAVTEMTIKWNKSNPLTVTVTVTEKFH